MRTRSKKVEEMRRYDGEKDRVREGRSMAERGRRESEREECR